MMNKNERMGGHRRSFFYLLPIQSESTFLVPPLFIFILLCMVVSLIPNFGQEEYGIINISSEKFAVSPEWQSSRYTVPFSSRGAPHAMRSLFIANALQMDDKSQELRSENIAVKEGQDETRESAKRRKKKKEKGDVGGQEGDYLDEDDAKIRKLLYSRHGEEGEYPLVQKQVLYVIMNEPVIHNHVASNLLHSLLYRSGVHHENIWMLDESLLQAHENLRFTAVLPLLVHLHQNNRENQNWEWLMLLTPFSRVLPNNLENLLQEKTLEEKEKISSSFGDVIINDDSFQSNNASGSDENQHYNGSIDKLGHAKKAIDAAETIKELKEVPYKGLALGLGINDEHPVITHHFHQNKDFIYPLHHAGLILSRTFLDFLTRVVALLPPRRSIQIDPYHEIFRILSEDFSFALTHEKRLCAESPFDDADMTDGNADHYCHKTHAERQSERGKKAARPEARERSENEGDDDELHGRGCAAFYVGNKRAPIMSHQIFDKYLHFENEKQKKFSDIIQKRDVSKVMSGEMPDDNDKLAQISKSRPSWMVELKDILVAVKTTKKNHGTRIPALRSLWASKGAMKEWLQHLHDGDTDFLKNNSSSGQEKSSGSAKKSIDSHIEQDAAGLNVIYFSDAKEKDDDEIIHVQDTKPDDERNNLCHKMYSILLNFYKKHPKRRFLYIADDDTLPNLKNLTDLLSMTRQRPTTAMHFVLERIDHRLRKKHDPYMKIAAELKKRFKSERKRHSRKGEEGIDDSISVYDHMGRDMSPLYLGERYSMGFYYPHLKGEGAQNTIDDISHDDGTERRVKKDVKVGDVGLGGYPYITGGGGIVLDRPAVIKIIEDCPSCKCPDEGHEADDMLLGIWMHRMKIPAIHTDGFHQAAPSDYHGLVLRAHPPISFHRMKDSVEETRSLMKKYVNVMEDSMESVDWFDHDWDYYERYGGADGESESLDEDLIGSDKLDFNLMDIFNDLNSKKKKKGGKKVHPLEEDFDDRYWSDEF